MTTFPLPYPEPVTRDEARQNAIHLMNQAERWDIDGETIAAGNATHRALVWSRIASAFPENMAYQPPNYPAPSDIRPNSPGQQLVPVDDVTETQVIRTGDESELFSRMILNGSGAVTRDPMPIQVNAIAWDVLRVLAARFVATTLERRTKMNLNSLAELDGLSLEMIQVPGEDSVHVVLSSEGVIP